VSTILDEGFKEALRLDSNEGLHHAWHPSMEEDNETYPS
jgi:hypothetical protein